MLSCYGSIWLPYSDLEEWWFEHWVIAMRHLQDDSDYLNMHCIDTLLMIFCLIKYYLECLSAALLIHSFKEISGFVVFVGCKFPYEGRIVLFGFILRS